MDAGGFDAGSFDAGGCGAGEWLRGRRCAFPFHAVGLSAPCVPGCVFSFRVTTLAGDKSSEVGADMTVGCMLSASASRTGSLAAEVNSK